MHRLKGDGANPVIAGVAITHPDRLISSRTPRTTKLDVVRYYEAVQERILPHLRARPLTLVQCAPDVEHCRYLRHSGTGAPAQVRVVNIQEQKKIGDYMVIDDVAGLIALAQRNILEFHTWNSTTKRLEQPDRIVLDLDPGPDVKWRSVVDAARLLRSTLQDLGLESWVKTTGGAGLHVVVPITPKRDWSVCLEFARSVAASLVEHDPTAYTLSFPKRGRERQILIDYLRNNRTNTAVCAYSVRSRPEMTVSVPMAWDELTPRLRPERWTIRSMPRRVKTTPDPWSGYFAKRQQLPI